MKIGMLFILFALIATLLSGWQYFSQTRVRGKDTRKRARRNGPTGDFQLARWAFYAMTALVSLAAVYLLYLILSHQFQVNYVYRYSSRDLPLGFLISSFWAGQEGSFLLWALLTALMGLVFIKTAGEFEAQAMLAINMVQFFFLAILLKASPFALLAGVPPDGAGLNPLLQNPWMVIHPPLLFVGYAAATFPFALAVAALMQREYRGYISKALPWAVFTSLTLGAGIIIGGYWAYKVLGWGGYWGWDPVENSSLVPWLTTLTLIHGLLLQRQSGALPKANFLLAILTFALVIYATFLTRSGVLADFSVHSFQDLGINFYLVLFIVAILGVGLGVFSKRYREIPFNELNLSMLNRESILLASMAVFAMSALLTFIGTSSPLFTGLLGNPAQVDISFYNIVHLPIGIALALFLGFAPYLRWQKTENLGATLLPSLLLSTTAVAAAFWLGMRTPLYLLFTGTAAFALWSNLLVSIKLLRLNWRYTAAPLSHLGVGLLLLGIIVSAVFEQARQVALEPGTPVSVLNHQLTYRGITKMPNGKDIVNIAVTSGDETYLAQPRFYYSEYNRSVMREPDVRAGWLADIYISPLELRQSQSPDEHSHILPLHKGETREFHGMAVTFREFEMGNHSGENAFRVGVKLDIAAEGETATVTPALIFSKGQRRSTPATLALPVDGKTQEFTVTLQAMDADQKMIELHFAGLDEAPPTASPAPAQLIVEVSKKPFMSVLWIGTIFITLGALIGLANRLTTPPEGKEPGGGKRPGKAKEVPAMSN